MMLACTVPFLLFLPLIEFAAPQIKGPSALKPVKSVFAGRVVTAAGKPLANVTVGIYGTTNAGENTRFEVQTNASGTYRQRVPAGIYGASAYYEKRYNGENYRFTLMPNDGTTAKKHDSELGVVKNFTWKISGLKPGEKAGEPGAHTEPLKYYGNSAQITMRQMGFDAFTYPAGSAVEVLFTPTGPLVDGSTGKPQKRVFNFAEATRSSSRNLYVTDIPVGAYKANVAFVAPSGTRQTLGLRSSLNSDAPFVESIPVPFKPTSFGDRQQFQITVDIPKG